MEPKIVIPVAVVVALGIIAMLISPRKQTIQHYQASSDFPDCPPGTYYNLFDSACEPNL